MRIFFEYAAIAINGKKSRDPKDLTCTMLVVTRNTQESRDLILSLGSGIKIHSLCMVLVFYRNDSNTPWQFQNSHPFDWNSKQYSWSKSTMHNFYLPDVNNTPFFEHYGDKPSILNNIIKKPPKNKGVDFIEIKEITIKDEEPLCLSHEEGKTPISGWIICKHCGVDLRKVGY